MKIQINISLKEKNWFQTGGNAKFFCSPKDESEFTKALYSAQKNNLEIFALGEGANILISDDGFDGLVIKPKLEKMEILKEEIVEAGAGVKIQDLVDFALNNNLVGLEEFSGVPGTVGGSVFINIHYFEYFLSDFLIEAKVINKDVGEIFTVDKSWFNFGYDTSKLHQRKHYLLSAKFKLKKEEPIRAAYAKGRRDEMIRQRNRRYPTSHTCGSFFRNFHDDEINFEINGKKMLFTAYYLDKIGIKGELRVGDAAVSHKHANMLINLGNSTTQEIVELAKEIQKMTFDKFGIIPKPECQLVGFKKQPLLI